MGRIIGFLKSLDLRILLDIRGFRGNKGRIIGFLKSLDLRILLDIRGFRGLQTFRRS